MPFACLHDRAEIERFLREEPALHVYELGDLDPAFFERTQWYGWREAGVLRAVGLVFHGGTSPVLLLLREGSPGAAQALLAALEPFLGPVAYAHLMPGLGASLSITREREARGLYRKMVLARPEALEAVDVRGVVSLGPGERPAIEALLARSYPGNWFDPAMLTTQRYVGLWEHGELVSVAGVHVYAPSVRVAALGNIVTAPERRGRGFAARCTARLCQLLRADTDLIGLNVRADHEAAIRCYLRLGFALVGTYEEQWLRARAPPREERNNRGS